MTDLKQCVTDSGNLPEQTFDWGSITVFSDDKLSPGAAQTLGICRILPGQQNPLHYHPNCEEVLHMLAGEGRHSFDDEAVELRPGSTIRIPIGVRHNLVNTGSETLTCLISFSSGTRESVFLD
jgi:quercetin dioxygenase-like cupin family protein